VIRLPIAMFGLAAWLVVGLGLRAWLGGKAYLVALFGSEVLAEQMLSRATDLPETTLLLGMDPWTLLLAFCTLVAAALVLLVLWPVDLLVVRFGGGVRVRMLVGAGLAAGATGAALLAIHPILALPSVPEGPRTVLNYACEAAGYGWINAIAYGGAIATGVAFAWLGTRARVEAAEASDEDGDDAEPAAADA